MAPAVRRALAWLRRWGVSFGSLAGGVATLFVFRRGLPHVGWIVGYLLLLWLLFAVLTETRQVLEASGRRGRRLVVFAADYTIQTLYHALLLFVLPAYWASTTLTSVNAPFFGLLVALALLATFDPWYRATVARLPWVTYVFFVVSMFAALDIALPLVGLPPFWSQLLSAWTAVAALAPPVRRRRGWSWRRAFLATAVGGLGAIVLVVVGRAWIPPVPLFLAQATLARDVADGEPVDPIEDDVSVQDLKGLVAYTAVHAPAGLRQAIAHVWRHESRVVTVVPLSPVHGGRREGFRTYSRKTVVPSNPLGRWSVDVVTSSGQLIGRLRFEVVP